MSQDPFKLPKVLRPDPADTKSRPSSNTAPSANTPGSTAPGSNVLRDILDDVLPGRKSDTTAEVHGHFVDYIGLQLTQTDGDRTSGVVDVDARLHQPYGIVHGGVYCAMVETLASVGGARWAIAQGMVGAVGLSNTTDFLRSVREGRITGVATPLHQGRTQQLWQVEIASADGKRVAHGQVRLQNITDPAVIGGIGGAPQPGILR